MPARPAPSGQIRATVSPTVNDDESQGYPLGIKWLNETTGEEFVLVNNATGAAVWKEVSNKVQSVNGQTGAITLEAGDVGAEASGAVSAHEAAGNPHNQYQQTSAKDQANGYAGLDGSGLVPDAKIPSTIARDTEVTAAVSAHEAALDPHAQYTTAAEAAAAAPVQSVNGQTGDVVIPVSSNDHGDLDGLEDDDHTQYQLRSEKGQANGYGSLDGSTQQPLSELKTMVGATGVAAGARGSVPQPGAGEQGEVLVGAAFWGVIGDTGVKGPKVFQNTSEGESTTGSTTYQQKLRLTFTAEAALYLIFWSFEAYDPGKKDVEVQGQINDADTFFEVALGADAYRGQSGFYPIVLTAGAKTIDIDYRSGKNNKTAAIRRARLMAIKVVQ